MLMVLKDGNNYKCCRTWGGGTWTPGEVGKRGRTRGDFGEGVSQHLPAPCPTTASPHPNSTVHTNVLLIALSDVLFEGLTCAGVRLCLWGPGVAPVAGCAGIGIAKNWRWERPYLNSKGVRLVCVSGRNRIGKGTQGTKQSAALAAAAQTQPALKILVSSLMDGPIRRVEANRPPP